MGVLRDLFAIAKHQEGFDFEADDIFEDDEAVGVSHVKSTSYDSIAKQAKSGVMQFPMISSRALSFDNIQMVSKAAERDFASFLQVIFTMNQITDKDNPADFVAQYHQNTKTNINGPSDMISLVFNSAEVPIGIQNMIMQAVKEGNCLYGDMFELSTINEKYIPKDVKRVLTMENQGGNSGRSPRPGPRIYNNNGPMGNVSQDRNQNKNVSQGNMTNTFNQNQYHDHTVNNYGGAGGKKSYNPHQIASDKLPRNVFVDNDARKANELIPTLLHVRILKESGLNGENSKFIDFIVGVKATIHPVTSEDMVSHIVSILQDHGKLFKFIKWTTGEISFFKDLVFNIDAIKTDINEVRTGKSSTWWRALKNIKASRRFHKWTRTGPVLPNASLVMSMEEVDFIKANYGYDLLEEEMAKKILEGYSLLEFIIVDPATEVVHFFADGSDRFNTVTFKGLERENGSAEKQFKDILRAVNKL